MHFDTKYFGNVEIPQEKILVFPDGIYGFEQEKKYFLVNFEPNDDSMLCMQSAQTAPLAFILFNPFNIIEDYQPKIDTSDLEKIKANKDDEFLVYVIAVIKENGDVTVNLKSPIVINPQTNLAIQVILENEKYSMRHPIITKEG